jgi:hypothetical protein
LIFRVNSRFHLFLTYYSGRLFASIKQAMIRARTILRQADSFSKCAPPLCVRSRVPPRQTSKISQLTTA